MKIADKNYHHIIVVMEHRDFFTWRRTFRKSIADYQYYTDFCKVAENVNRYKVEINILNSLIGSDDIETDFLSLIRNYPEILNVIPLFLAKREMEIFAMDKEGSFDYNFSEPNQTPEQYAVFMRKTGLFDLISKRIKTISTITCWVSRSVWIPMPAKTAEATSWRIL